MEQEKREGKGMGKVRGGGEERRDRCQYCDYQRGSRLIPPGSPIHKGIRRIDCLSDRAKDWLIYC